MGLKDFGLGLIAGLCLFGCAGAAFPYRYYALDAESYSGSLRGPEPKDDISLLECRPSDSDKAPCMVMRTDSFLKVKLEYKDMQDKLKACERGGRHGS